MLINISVDISVCMCECLFSFFREREGKSHEYNTVNSNIQDKRKTLICKSQNSPWDFIYITNHIANFMQSKFMKALEAFMTGRSKPLWLFLIC